METETPTFGQFKIYKMLEKPYEYIMLKSYTSLIDDKSLEKKKDRYQNLPTHKNIINFDFVDFKRGTRLSLLSWGEMRQASWTIHFLSVLLFHTWRGYTEKNKTAVQIYRGRNTLHCKNISVSLLNFASIG